MKNPGPVPRPRERLDRQWGLDILRYLEKFMASLDGVWQSHSELITDQGRSLHVTLVITATYTILKTDDVVDVNFAGAVTLTLPETPRLGQRFIVQDSSGAASTNNITINGSASKNLNGGANFVIVEDYQKVEIEYNGTQYIATNIYGAFTGNVTIGGDLDVTGDLTVNDIDASGTIHADGDIDTDTNLIVDGTSTLTGDVLFQGDILYEDTFWDNIRVPMSAVKLGQTNPPGWITFNGGDLVVLGFDDARKENVYFTVQLPHSYKEGTDLEAHIHWSPITTNGGNVMWDLEYQWANISATFPASTVVPLVDAADGTAWKHQIHEMTSIDGTGKELSSMLVCRLSRLGADGGDTHVGDAALLGVDFHYQIDAPGSYTEYTK